MKSRCRLSQFQRIAAAWLIGDHPQEHAVDFAVEPGELRVGANSFFHRAFGGGAVKTRQIFPGHQRAQALDLQRDLLVIGGRGLVTGIEPDRGGVILQRADAVALASIRRAAIVVGAGEFRIQPQRRIVIGDGAVVILLALICVAAVGEEFRFGRSFIASS